MRIKVGAYAQLYISTTSGTKHRTVGVIALIPVNERGTYYFMSLATVKQLHTFIWTEISINDQVISRVNDLATKEKQPEMTKRYPIFSGSHTYQSQTKTTRHKVKNMKYFQHTKTSTMTTSPKMENMKKALNKRHIKMSTHQTERMIQVTISSNIKTKITKKTPPLKMTSHK